MNNVIDFGRAKQKLENRNSMSLDIESDAEGDLVIVSADADALDLTDDQIVLEYHHEGEDEV